MKPEKPVLIMGNGQPEFFRNLSVLREPPLMVGRDLRAEQVPAAVEHNG